MPAAERRRATPSTRIALTAAQQALTHAGLDATNVPAVFGSSSGNPDIIHDICAMLAAGDYQISPTKFHNSVHNAASGYYSIAVASHRAVTSLCALDGTATAALLETAVQAIAAQTPVLMVCYDLPYPFPLSEARPTIDAWSLALVLAPAEFEPAVAQPDVDRRRGERAEDAADTALDRHCSWSRFASAIRRRGCCRCSPRLRSLDSARSCCVKATAVRCGSTVAPC